MAYSWWLDCVWTWKQVDTVLWQDDVAQEIHHRNHQRYAEEYDTDCTFAPQVCKQLYHEPYFSIGSISLLRQQAKGFAGILHRRHQTAVTILRAKQLLPAFCYYPLLMAWEGGVCTLHLYCIRHSVTPNWGNVINERFLFCLITNEANNTGNLWVNFHPCIHDWLNCHKKHTTNVISQYKFVYLHQ